MDENRQREVLTELLSLYTDLPCLWDIGSDAFKDKNQRSQAWELLKEKLKEIEPEVTLAATKKKVDNMRTAFQRECKKVKASKRTGAGANDVHVPNLWYYSLLLPIFEKKDDQSRCGVDTLSSDEESRSSEHEKGRKRKINTLEMKKETLIDTAQKLLNEEKNEKQEKINSFGLYVGEQLDQVETFQRQVAEKLISDILFLAKTGNLNFESRIETTASSRNIAFSRSSSSNNYYMQQASLYEMMNAYPSTPSPHYITQPSPSPHYITQPSPSPQYIQPPSSSPQHIQPAPSPQHFQPAPSPHQIQSSPLSSSSVKRHFKTSSQNSHPSTSHNFRILSQQMQASPSPQNRLLSTALQTQLPANDESENIVQISIPSPRNSTSIYEGPASGISDFLIFKKEK